MIDLEAQKKKLKELASRLFQKNKYEKVLDDYLALAEEHPSDMRIRLKVAETYFKSHDIDHAVESYRQVAEHYEREDFILKAVAVYKSILKLNPALVEVNLKLAELYEKLSMPQDVGNQYRIVMETYATLGDKEKVIETCRKLVELDPSPLNRRKLAEIYQTHGLTKQAVEQYEIMAREFRLNKEYDNLLRMYELILPHKTKNQAIIKDICILYLRRQEADNAIRTMERYKVDAEPEFVNLYEKAQQMKNALRKQPPR